MNLDYLKNTILPQRAKEFAEGKNEATRQPIYVVYSLEERACEGHSEFINTTNHKGKEKECGYIDRSLSEPDFCTTDDDMLNPQPVTRFWVDNAKAFFLTSKAAHDYLQYQAHNLNEGYVYVHYSGYANREMDQLLCNG